jgi:hypothetical protein
VALFQRLRAAEQWLRWIADRLWQRHPTPESLQGYRARAIDATIVSRPGSRGTDWRVHFGVTFHTTEAPKAVERTLLTPGLLCQIRALALERGTTVRHDSRPRCRCMVRATARMRSTARLPHLPTVRPILHGPSSSSPATS